MFRKNYFKYVLMIAAILIGSTAVFAQTASITGRVQMTDGGEKKGVSGAVILVYNQETKEKASMATAKENGEFDIADLPKDQVFSLIISGSGIDSTLVSDIRPGSRIITIAVVKGDGIQPTDEEIKKVIVAAAENIEELTPEQKKAREETESKNVKTEESNAAIRRLNDEGIKAYEKKNFDVAITKFEEGYQVNPEYLGSAPGFLNVKGASLRERAIQFHNAGATDPATKVENYKKSAEDFGNAIETYYKSWMIIKNATEAQKSEIKNLNEIKMQNMSGVRDLVYYAVLTNKVDAEKVDKVKELLNEYVNFESDKKKKAEGETLLADYYRLGYNYDTAISMYRKILSNSPNEPGALFGLGLSLYTAAYRDDGSVDKAKLQEAANSLKRFTDVAPSDSKRDLKAAQDTLETLKEGENISPKKS